MRFDLGTAYLFNSITEKSPVEGAMKGFDEAILMVWVAYLRQCEKANLTEREFDLPQFRSAIMDLHAAELIPYSRAFNSILVTTPIADLQEPEGGATPEEKKAD